MFIFKPNSSCTLVYNSLASRFWKLDVPIPSPASSIISPLIFPPPTPSVSRARTRAKLRGNGCLCDRVGWAARSEHWAAWVCNVRHVGHGVLNRTGTAERSSERDRQTATKTRACPALFALLTGPESLALGPTLTDTATDSSMRTRSRRAVTPGSSQRFMLRLLL